MLALVLLVAFILIYALRFKSSGGAWRRSFLSASIIWAVLLTLITESLTLLRLLTFGWVLALWVVAILALLIMWRVAKRELHVGSLRPQLPTFLWALMAGVGLIIATVGLTALAAPSNNWDSMTYHMSRVAHWIQNQGVGFYPTNITRQLNLSPWAEYAITNLQLLSRGDRLVNLVQWFSMVGSILGVTLIARQLGADKRGQVFAAVVAVTIPMGILQASSTQNDHVLAFWLVCFVYYSLLFKDKPKLAYAAGVGAALGLAILTKGTAYVYMLPFLLLILVSSWQRLRFEFWKPIAVIGILVLAINFGHLARNYDVYGSPLATEDRYANDVYSVPVFLSNVIRNLSLHVGTPVGRVNAAIENGIVQTHRLLNIDPSDPRTSWPGSVFQVKTISNGEDTAGNLIHLFLVPISLAVVLLASKKSKYLQGSLIYFSLVAAAFLLQSLLLKWQPWNSRLHLPIFILWSPFIALALARIKNHKLANSVIVLLFVFALPWLIYNKARPLVGDSSVLTTNRIDQYFNRRPEQKDSYIGAVKFVTAQGCKDVGLLIRGDDWEYPLWVLFKESSKKEVRIEHVGVRDESALKARSLDDFDACAIIAKGDQKNEIVVDDQGRYIQAWSSKEALVYLPKDTL